MFSNQIRQIEEDIVPFGFIDNGSAAIDQIEANEKGYDIWQTWGGDPY